MKVITLTSVLIILSLSQKILSQYTQEWVARYNYQNYDDYANNLVLDKEGNVYVTGQSDYRYLTVKYNSNGNQLWSARYNESYPIPNDVPHAISLDPNGGVYVTGEAMSTSYDMEYATIKYNTDGNQLWANIFNSSFNDRDRATAMAVDNNNNLIVTGFSISPCSNGNFIWNTFKYSPNGSQIWNSSYCENNYIPLAGIAPSPALALDSSGNIIIAGSSEDTTSATNQKYSIIKYDQGGHQL